jgi:hypothetical protein
MPKEVTRQAGYICPTTEARSSSHCCSGKGMSITYSESVFLASGIQHAMHIRHIVTVACPIEQYLSPLSHKRHDYRKKTTLLNIKCVFWFSIQLYFIYFLYNFILYTTFAWNIFLVLRRFDRDIMNVHWSSCKVPVILVRFSKNAQIPNFMKIRPVGEELFHADRRTDITKLTVAFRNFVKAHKKLW